MINCLITLKLNVCKNEKYSMELKLFYYTFIYIYFEHFILFYFQLFFKNSPLQLQIEIFIPIKNCKELFLLQFILSYL